MLQSLAPSMAHMDHGTAALRLLSSVVLLAAVVLGQVPEPNCNSNKYEGNEVWSSAENFIGQGTGEFWWGQKSSQATWPVSWIDNCAKRLERCQSNSAILGSLSGFKPACVCEMWTCLNQPTPTSSLPQARPLCQFVQPLLLNYYCSTARFINATCVGSAYVPLPAGGLCPDIPAEGITFDDIPGDGVRIPSGYQALEWDNWYMLDGDSYQVKNGYFAGVISSPKVAFNGYGYPASFNAPGDSLMTLHSLYLVSAWDEDNIITLAANDAAGATLGTYIVPLTTDNPLFIDLSAPTLGQFTGTFAGIKGVTVTTSGTQVTIDNVHVTLDGDAAAALPPQQLEFYRAPPGASGPMRKPHRAVPLREQTG